MSIRAVRWALEQRVGNPLRKGVLIDLGEHHNDETGESFPSIELIAKEMEMTERSVRTHLKGLEEDGFLTSFKRGRHKVYRLAIPAETPAGDSGEAEQTPASPSPIQESPSATPESPSKTPAGDSAQSEGTNSNRKGTGEGARKRATRATPIPADWVPSPEGFQFARNQGLTDEQINRALERFIDFHLGTGRRAADWEAIWRNWIREDVRRADEGAGGMGRANGAGPRADQGGAGRRTTQGDRERAMAAGLARGVEKAKLRSPNGSG